MKKARTLRELFSFPGFISKYQLEGQFGDPKARIIVLERQKKRQYVLSVTLVLKVITIERSVACAIVMSNAIEYIFAMKDGEYIATNVMAYAWRH